MLCSDEGLGGSGDASSAKLSHGGENAVDIGASGELGLDAGLDVGVLGEVVLEELGGEGEGDEVGVGHLVTGGVGTAISPVSIKLGQECLEVCGADTALLLGGVVLHEGVLGGLLDDVTNESFHPADLVSSRGSLRPVAVLDGEHLEDSHGLGKDGAVVLDPAWELGAFSVGVGGLDGSPFSEGVLNVLKLDTLGAEHVADGLGATLEREVYELWHLVKTKRRYFQLQYLSHRFAFIHGVLGFWGLGSRRFGKNVWFLVYKTGI